MRIEAKVKPTKIWMYINEYGMLFLQLSKPIFGPGRKGLLLSEQTVDMIMPSMTEDQQSDFYNTEAKLTKRAGLEKQIEIMRAELDQISDDS